MATKLYLAIGDTIKLGGIKYECSPILNENESGPCLGCSFNSDALKCNSVDCMKSTRPDNNYVIFKKTKL